MLAITILAIGLTTVVSGAALPTTLQTQVVQPTGLPYPEGPITITSKRGEEPFNMTGYHHEIADALLAADPSRYDDFVSADAFLNSTSHLEKRSNRVSQACLQRIFAAGDVNNQPGSPSHWADTQAIQDGINTMAKNWSDKLCQVAPKNCGRFACSKNSAILMCNDNPFAVTIPCATLIQNARFVASYCQDYYIPHSIQGQAFYINPSYNVLIKHTDPGKGC